jgi:hypothetical protein
MYVAITPTQQLRALTWLLSAGHLKHCKGLTLAQVLELPVAAKLVNLHATLIAQGTHPQLSPAKPACLSHPSEPRPPTPPRPAWPPAYPHHPKHYFDARRAAAGDLIDQEDD